MKPISGATRVAAVIGEPVRHSLSPAVHNAAYEALGIDWRFVALEVAEGRAADALVGMRALGLAGLSVTMPHKHAVAQSVDVLTPAAAALGAVNCVSLLADGRLEGSNTDGPGFVDSLVEAGVSPEGLSVVVLGAGGAATAVVEALGRRGARSVLVVNRTADRAAATAALAGSIGGVVGPGELRDALIAAGLVVNATPIGMGTEKVPFDPSWLRAGQVVADLVYHPVDTALLRAARAAGATAVDGVGMLVHQAAHAVRRWTGLEAPVAAMRAAAEAELAARRARPD